MEKEELTKKFIMVRMNDTKISTVEKNIIGTQALATCIGVLVYNEEKKKAIVSHISGNAMGCFSQILNLLVDNGLDNTQNKYAIFEGFYFNHENIFATMKKYFNSFPTLFIPFSSEELKQSVQLDEETKSYEFAFDSLTGKFVTKQVIFGREYYEINGPKIGYESEDIQRKNI